jgi:membrane protein DedA with SNARE-associated domain
VLFPSDLASFLDLLRQHGDAAYSFMFAYSASHSLLFGLFAGYAAHSGALALGTLIAVCWIGSFAGDVLRFWIGRKYGARLLRKYPRLERGVQTAARLADRHYFWMIMIHRFPHGIRGMAGYAFGQVSEKLMNDASSTLGLVMLVGFLGLSWFLSKKLEQIAEKS